MKAKAPYLSTIFAFALSFTAFSADIIELALPKSASDRAITLLNGIRECCSTADSEVKVPESFDNTIPVPGLWTCAAKPLGLDVKKNKPNNSPKGRALWYRFPIKTTSIPEAVFLRIRMAEYGRVVYVNGERVAYHTYNFTPSMTDITSYLKPNAVNEVVVRLTNYDAEAANPESKAHLAWDRERSRSYFPCILDDVTLVASGRPRILYMQNAVTDLAGGKVLLRAFVTNDTAKAVTTPVTFRVTKLGVIKNGKEPTSAPCVGEETVMLTLQPGEGRFAEIPAFQVKDFNAATDAWSPENPALYRLTVTTARDTATRRFGMRTFDVDTTKRCFMLNGKQRIFLGANICFFRFFDDPLVFDLPWQDGWFRQLFQEFKDVGWDSFRVHVALFPKKALDLCDEMGFLVQDEFPYWQNCSKCKCNEKTLTPEVRAWMQDHQMCPSTVIWDVQNESMTEKWLTKVVQAVRGDDPQNRPWQNGWLKADSPRDVIESHPYNFSCYDFSLGYLMHRTRVPNTFGNKIDTHVTIINEYEYQWINRLGEPSALSKPAYDLNVPSGKPEDCIRFYDYSLAALTEFWRLSGYATGGIHHFSGLMYSLPAGKGGFTSDELDPDLAHPKMRASTKARIRDCYARVMIGIDDYTADVIPGTTQTFNVSLLNDSDDDINALPGKILLTRNGKTIFEKDLSFTAKAHTRADNEVSIIVPKDAKAADGIMTLTASYTRDGETYRSIREWTINERPVGLAYKKPAKASSIQTPIHGKACTLPAEAVDGMPTTRWQSRRVKSKNKMSKAEALSWQDQYELKWGKQKGELTGDLSPWLEIDLEKVETISSAYLRWMKIVEFTYIPAKFEIQVRTDTSSKWTTIAKGTEKGGLIQKFSFEPVAARYIRIQSTGAIRPGRAMGICDFDVYK